MFPVRGPSDGAPGPGSRRGSARTRGRDPAEPGGGVASGGPPGRPERGRRRHPGRLPPGLEGAPELPRRVERPDLAPLHRPPGLCRRRPAPVAMAQADGAAPLRVGDDRGRRGTWTRCTAWVTSSPASRPPSGRRSCSPRSPVAPTPRRPSCAAWRSGRSAPEWHALASSSSTWFGPRRRSEAPVRHRAATGAMILEMRFVRGLVIAATGAIAVVVVAAQPAAAHDVPGIKPSNFETTVDSTAPRVPGLAVRPIDLGNELELRNHTGVDVVVLGYQGEPYLRVGPRGVFENRRSPATYLNRTRDGKTHVPGIADPTAAPEWNRLASGTVARWHDHRAHWMGTEDPPEVLRAPDQRHVVDQWSLAASARITRHHRERGLALGARAEPVGVGTRRVGAGPGGRRAALTRTHVWRWVLAGALGRGHRRRRRRTSSAPGAPRRRPSRPGSARASIRSAASSWRSSRSCGWSSAPRTTPFRPCSSPGSSSCSRAGWPTSRR